MISASSLTRRQRWLVTLLLAAAGLLINLVPLTLSPGIHWLFGGIAYLLAASVLGPVAGGFAAAVASVVTIPLWNHPWAWVIFTAEALIIGLLVTRWQLRTLTAAGVFWALMGLPLLFAFYAGLMGVGGTTLTIIALKQPVNGLVNAAIVEAMLLIPRLRVWLGIGNSPRLRSALSVLTFTAALVPALAFGAWAGRREWTRSMEVAGERVELLAQSYASKLEQYVILHQQSVRALAHTLGGGADLNIDRVRRLVASEFREFRGFESLTVLTPDGEPILVYPASAPPAEIPLLRVLWADGPADASWLDRTAVTDVIRVGQGPPTVLLGHWIVSAEGERLGVVAGSLALGRVPPPVTVERDPELVRVFDRGGRLVINPAQPYHEGDLPRVLTDWDDYSHLRTGNAPGTTVVQRTSAVTAASQAAAHVLVGFAPLPTLGWWSWVEHPFTRVEASVAEPFARLLGLLSVFMIVAAMVSTLVAGWMAAPLLRLRWATAALAGGQRDVRVRKLPPGVPRELEELATGFDEMAAALAGRAEELEELSEITRSLASTLESGPLLRHITDAAARLVNADGCGITLLGAGGQELHAEDYSLGLLAPAAGKEIPLQGSMAGWVVEHARPVRVTRVDPSFTLFGSAVQLETIGSIIGAPLIGRSGPLGALAAVRSEHNEPFSADNLQLLERLARTAAIAVENARLIETAQSASRAKSDFIAAMSHELRTPLNAVLGHLQLLDLEIHGPLKEKQREALARIGTATRHLSGLIEEVLSFARLEAGRATIDIEVVDVGELVEEVGAVIEPLAEQKDLVIRVEVPATPATVQTDPDKVRQILINLAGNAVKFTERGEVRLSVEHRLRQIDDTEPPREEVVVHVTDSGPGIEPDDRRRIFEPFVQLDSGLSRRYGGTGLGLYLSVQYAGLIGGAVEVESEVGVGSTFSLVLPRVVAAVMRVPQSLTSAEMGSGLRR